MAEFVVKSICREGARLYGSAIAPEARCFALGVLAKLKERIAEIKASLNTEIDKDNKVGTALALINLNKAEQEANSRWLAEQGVRLKTKASHTKGVTDSAAYGAGKDFGARVSLSPQVGATRNTNKAISK
jgi:hypothetical protein